MVVSRRALLQADRETQARDTRAGLSLGDAIEGLVTRLVPFGAFIDIGVETFITSFWDVDDILPLRILMNDVAPLLGSSARLTI